MKGQIGDRMVKVAPKEPPDRQGENPDRVGWGDQRREIWEEAELDFQALKRPSAVKGPGGTRGEV